MAKIDVTCPSCCSVKGIYRNGRSRSGHQLYLCQSCRHSWQLEFTYAACRPGTHKQIVDMAMNGMGCRATARVMGIGLNTVLRHLKNLKPKSVTEAIKPSTEVIACCEMDKQWSYVKSKKQPRWLFYAYDSIRRKVIAHVFGPRTKKTLMRLLALLTPFNIVIYMTDGWQSHEKALAGKLHVASKRYTQRIERHNLNLRQHLERLTRKTLSFSKSIEMHDRIIGYYLNIHHYQ
ncbi:IS1 family transposase [Xenorhabdus bovienii]|uniref:IS1 family transposase n=1 Tax=Xenorhabdus bovienii TaxID=40576 RepID=UPI00237C82E2|nr:IS1 family transposase [Xenorhabdus bovienii]